MTGVMTEAFMAERDSAATTFSMAGLVGAYFCLRVSITLLFFSTEPQAGAWASLVVNLLLLVPVGLYAAGPAVIRFRQIFQTWPARFALGFLALSLVSLSWTEAQSRAVAFGYWIAMAADVVLVLLLLLAEPTAVVTESLFKGFIFGACLLALIGWLMPTMPDLRIGNDDFLSPNVIGFNCAIGALFCQQFSPQGARWKWIGAALAITLLRSLSKTSIIAFLIAEAFFLTSTNTITRAGKIALACGASAVLFLFSGLLASYYTVYVNAGNQVETLTGRTGIWVSAVAFALEEPWLGHGFHSFHNVVPVIGTYQSWHAHNELLQQFFTYGIVGVVLVLALYVSLFIQIRRSRGAPIALLTRSLLLLVWVRGLVDTERFDLSLPLWAIVALSLTLAQTRPRYQEVLA